MVKKLSQSVREYKKPALLTSLCVIIEVILEVMIPYSMANLIDYGIYASDMNEIIKYGIILILLAGLSLTFGFLSGSFAAKASSGFAKNLRHDIYYKIQDFSFYNIDKFSPASLVTRLTTDVNYVQTAFQMTTRMAIRAPITLIFTMILTLTINWKIALIFVLASPILLLGLFLILKNVRPIFNKVVKEYDDINRVVEENVRGMRVVKSYVREEHEIEKFNKVSDDIYRDYSKGRKLMSFASPVMQFTVYTCMLLVSWFGARIIVTSGGTELATGQLTTLFSYAMQVLSSLMMLSFYLVVITISRPSAERINEVLVEIPNISNPEKPIKSVKNGDIEFDGVSFSYKNDISKLCLKNINLSIKSGSTIGILGNTGSSKSTLISLIPRLYDATSGKVLVGGENVKNYDIKTLRDSVAVVLQKNTLFSGTVKENLMWGNEKASMQQIKHACKVACADEFIEKMPQKYDTHIEQGGSNVSGGQKQRLCIARALLKKPKILILDDSTSAVDTKTDTNIRNAFKTELPDTTKIIISQRISSIQGADRIIMMDNGCILAQGTHEELLKSNDIYKEIYLSQNNKGGKK